MEMDLTYEVTCKICKTQGGDDELQRTRGKYIGITGRTGHKRGSEHMTAAKNMDIKYGIGKHYSLHHSNVAAITEDPIEMKILSSQPKLLDRLIDEGIRLEKAPQLANSKSEWGRGGGLVRFVAGRTQDTRATEIRNRQNSTNTDTEDSQNRQNNIPDQVETNLMTVNLQERENGHNRTPEQLIDGQEHLEIDLSLPLQSLEPRRNPRRNRRNVLTQYEDIIND